MKSVTYTVDDNRLLDVLRGVVHRCGTQTAAAAELGVTQTYIGDVLNGRRSISALAGRLGFTSLTVYVPEGEEPAITAADAVGLIDGLRRRRMHPSNTTTTA